MTAAFAFVLVVALLLFARSATTEKEWSLQSGAAAVPLPENDRRLQSSSAAVPLPPSERRLQAGSAAVPLPVNYYPSTIFSSGFILKSNNLVGVVALPSSYVITFDLFPTLDSSECRNIIHLTASGNNIDTGGRLPGLWFCVGNPGQAFHLSYTGGGPNNMANTATPLPLNSWSSVTIAVDAVNLLMV